MGGLVQSKSAMRGENSTSLTSISLCVRARACLEADRRKCTHDGRTKGIRDAIAPEKVGLLARLEPHQGLIRVARVWPTQSFTRPGALRVGRSVGRSDGRTGATGRPCPPARPWSTAPPCVPSTHTHSNTLFDDYDFRCFSTSKKEEEAKPIYQTQRVFAEALESTLSTKK